MQAILILNQLVMCVAVALALTRAKLGSLVSAHVYCCEIPLGTAFQKVVVMEAKGEVLVVVFMEG